MQTAIQGQTLLGKALILAETLDISGNAGLWIAKTRDSWLIFDGISREFSANNLTVSLSLSGEILPDFVTGGEGPPVAHLRCITCRIYPA